MYWSLATANIFILIFDNISNIFGAFFKELALISIRKCEVSVSVSKFQSGLSLGRGLGGYGLDYITGKHQTYLTYSFTLQNNWQIIIGHKFRLTLAQAHAPVI